jgi:hypothetical protein
VFKLFTSIKDIVNILLPVSPLLLARVQVSHRLHDTGNYFFSGNNDTIAGNNPNSSDNLSLVTTTLAIIYHWCQQHWQ